VNLGTRPPLKHYQIIDMVCDQASGRIYTLNANWILEIWNIEQGACFPQKRLAVCANEGGKEFINLYYTATFSNSKPRFLSLQQSNQQILLVNTTCVDGSIVFIDPISFSVLKKIQLKYSDYEIPKIIKDSIRKLQNIFDDIGKNQGTDVGKIFADITHRDTQEVKIRDFVAKLVRLDPKLVEEDLFKTCRVLDADGSGTITLDEFLEFFGNLNAEEQDLLKVAEELEDKIWPEWLIKEGKLAYAQGLLTSMHSVLENDHGITAEQAFGIYDMKDCGECSPDEFKRVLRIFFGEVLPEPEVALEFLMRMTQQRANKKIAYREFCKFLSKRVVRTFQGASSGPETDGAAKGNVQRELERPLIKEACLAYVLRKSAELGLDLRKVIAENDKNGLNVIPRSKFICLLLDLPLGLNEVEVAEILENDLNFDNYGNVDYNVILNSDLFVHLERDRLKKTHKKRRGVVLDGNAVEEEAEAGRDK
jgi:Ca2+-binding EF-hand superfamily protein